MFLTLLQLLPTALPTQHHILYHSQKRTRQKNENQKRQTKKQTNPQRNTPKTRVCWFTTSWLGVCPRGKVDMPSDTPL